MATFDELFADSYLVTDEMRAAGADEDSFELNTVLCLGSHYAAQFMAIWCRDKYVRAKTRGAVSLFRCSSNKLWSERSLDGQYLVLEMQTLMDECWEKLPEALKTVLGEKPELYLDAKQCESQIISRIKAVEIDNPDHIVYKLGQEPITCYNLKDGFSWPLEANDYCTRFIELEDKVPVRFESQIHDLMSGITVTGVEGLDIQLVLGYLLTGHVSEQINFSLHTQGEARTSNGLTDFQCLLRKILGGYFVMGVWNKPGPFNKQVDIADRAVIMHAGEAEEIRPDSLLGEEYWRGGQSKILVYDPLCQYKPDFPMCRIEIPASFQVPDDCYANIFRYALTGAWSWYRLRNLVSE